MTLEEMTAAIEASFREAVGTPAEEPPATVTAQLWQISMTPPAADISEEDFDLKYADPVVGALAYQGRQLGLTHFTAVTIKIKARRPGVQPTLTATVRGW